MTPQALLDKYGPREAMEYDVVIVGAGPAGLAAAIRLKQLQPEASVVVIEKGSEPGAHILSGAVMDPRAITELLPDWKERGAPLLQPVTGDDVLFLSPTGSRRTPDWLVPRNLHNHGCYVVSLSNVVKWMAQQAEALGVEIFPGFAAAEVLYDEQGCVAGVATGNMGITKEGEPGENFQLGMELRGKYTVFAEGARGHLGKQLLARYKLTEGRDTQTFAIGIKELWELPADKAQPGRVVHTAGWPMAGDTFGGGFLYHLADNQVTLGFVIGLDYANPYLSPFEEMQRWKTHPAIRAHIEGGKRIGYGARAINNGTPQALPKTVFPGGALVGCDAGYLNAARIKGSHAAIKSGMLCAEALAPALAAGRAERLQLFERAQMKRGADDYIAKPFGVQELLARIRVSLKRTRKMSLRDDVYQVDALQIDVANQWVKLGDTTLHLTPIEFKLIFHLAQKPGKVFSHRQLLSAVWGSEYVDEIHYLRIHMGRLRAKIEHNPAMPRYILTESGIGYRLAAQ